MKYDFQTLAPRWGDEAPMWEHLAAQGITDPEVIDMGVAEMKFFPAPEIQLATAKQAQSGTFGYSGADAAFQNTVCDWMLCRHNWHIEPDWIVQTYGLVPAIGYAIRALTESGDGVLVCFPSYRPFSTTVIENDRKLFRSDLVLRDGRYEMDWADIEKKLSDPSVKAFILCNPHNPTGRVWTRAELARVGELCLKNKVAVISDDIHCDIVFPPYEHIPFAAISQDFAENCVMLTAPSKTFNIAGMTISNMIIPGKAFREKVFSIVSRDMGHYINAFGLCACKTAYTEAGGWLDEALEVLKGNADYLRAFCNERLPGIKLNEQEGTYLCWADFSELGFEPDALNALLYGEARFMSERGTDFGDGFGQFQRINVACPREYLEKALLRLEKTLTARNR